MSAEFLRKTPLSVTGAFPRASERQRDGEKKIDRYILHIQIYNICM